MRLLTLRELANLGTALELAQWQLSRMPRSNNRLFGTKLLRTTWSTYRSLKAAIYSETNIEFLKAQLEELNNA